MFSSFKQFSASYQPIQPVEKAVVAGLLIFSALLFFITYTLDPHIAHTLTKETGLFEMVSPPLWVGLAVLCLLQVSHRTRYGIGTALLSLIFAAREMDLHKAFTADSIFKNAYYRMDISVTEKLLGGLAAALCVGILVWMLVACVRYLWRERAWRQTWGRLTMLSIALIVFTKVCDRLEAVLREDYGILMTHMHVVVLHMHEEGFEALLPIMFAIALLCWRRHADHKAMLNGEIVLAA